MRSLTSCNQPLSAHNYFHVTYLLTTWHKHVQLALTGGQFGKLKQNCYACIVSAHVAHYWFCTWCATGKPKFRQDRAKDFLQANNKRALNKPFSPSSRNFGLPGLLPVAGGSSASDLSSLLSPGGSVIGIMSPCYKWLCCSKMKY